MSEIFYTHESFLQSFKVLVNNYLQATLMILALSLKEVQLFSPHSLSLIYGLSHPQWNALVGSTLL